jgi:hypothetical protein
MSADLDTLLLTMLTIALQKADRVPTPAEPPDAASEKAADAFCLRFADSLQAEMPTPQIAAAMIPRLRIARTLAGVVEHQFDMQARLGDRSADEHAILEWLLVRLWHESWKARWIAGEIV